MTDEYRTIATKREGYYTEKRSKFLAFAHPVGTTDEVKDIVARYRKRYYDARHVCWAYMIGTARDEYLSSDNGEPSGTAGKPILGQINSFELTNVVIAVVRYFGGIKLGTSGLIVAYREAARLAITAGEILECHEQAQCRFAFPYLSMNAVMSLVKKADLRIVEQTFDNVCSMTVECDADAMTSVRQRISDIDGTSFID